ncbi:glycosyltransferase family 4 protein [Sulfitobacter sp.]|uniref:glycosyltransferase family 4 protein n=1 Tax=Sulfitobacter sp. TaxID=1903071 RepID=UPI002609E881|nr:glycosyltransferase family 4 protein [Sulfitobacter sp.]
MHVLLTGNTTFKLANFREGLIRRLLADGHRVTIVAPPDKYVEIIRTLGCEFIPVQMERNGTSPLVEARLLFSLFNVIRRGRPDVVFSYTIKNNIYGGIACRVLGVPFVPNVTGLGPAFNKTGVLNRTVRTLYRVAFGKARTVFFQNSSDLELFTSSRVVSNGRVRLLPGSGVDLDRFAASPLPESGEDIRFLLVARLLWDKGVGVYADAARKIRKTFPQARFQLLGPLDPDSKSGINGARLDEWIREGVVEYLGSTDDVVPFLRVAHCVVLPSYYGEGTPRSLLEAGAIGRPIITTDMPGCRDVVIANKTGFLVAPRDTEELAAACIAFLRLRPEMQARMGAASRQHIAQNYDEEIVINAYLGIMDELSATKRGI